MRDRPIVLAMALLIAVALSPLLISAQSIQPATGSKTNSGPAPKRDMSGVWAFQSIKTKYEGGTETPAEDTPPMTPWAQAKYAAAKPGYGPKAAPGGNDPILQCDPMGFPRILFFPTPSEFIQTPNRVIQFFERDHQWREIWTDGRSMPKDLDPNWFGYSIGKWEDDYTFVVETAGMNDKIWTGVDGYPQSEEMHVTERYHRVDHDTMEFNITMVDPKAYTKPWIGTPRTLQLQPKVEIPQFLCVFRGTSLREEDQGARRRTTSKKK